MVHIRCLAVFNAAAAKAQKHWVVPPKYIRCLWTKIKTHKLYPLFKPECRSRLNRTRPCSIYFRENINFPQKVNLVDSCFGLRAIFAIFVRKRRNGTNQIESFGDGCRSLSLSPRAKFSCATITAHGEAQVTRILSPKDWKEANHNKSWFLPWRPSGKSPIDASHSSMVTAATMNAEEAVPYIWEERPPPPEQVLKLWYEVGNKLDKESTGEHRRAVVTRCCAKLVMSHDFGNIVFCVLSRGMEFDRVSLDPPKPIRATIAVDFNSPFPRFWWKGCCYWSGGKSNPRYSF